MLNLKTFYKTKEWELVRKQVILDRLTPEGATICEYCGKPILQKFDIIAHHKIELTEANVNDLMISLNPDNLMLVHLKCHRAIHDGLGFTKKQHVYIVWGSVGAGKTTWVLNQMSDHDMIIDIDLLYKTFNPKSVIKPKEITSIVFDIWHSLTNRTGLIAERKGTWRNCYIVSCLPNKMQREEIANNLNAELIHIDTSKEECLQRILNDPTRKDNLEQHIEWLNNYWDELIE